MKSPLSAIARMAGGAVLVASLAAPVMAASSSVYVDDTACSPTGAGTRMQPYCTIQQGVDAVASGGTVHVAPGTYTTATNVTKPVTITGAGGSGSPTDASRSVVSNAPFAVAADDVRVKGFTFTGNTSGPGLSTSGAYSGYYIENNIFTGNVFGLYFNASGIKDSYAKNNTFTNNNAVGSASGNGIYSDQNLRNATINNNTFSGNQGFAVLIAATPSTINDNVTVKDNTITSGGGGVLFVKVNNSTIRNNTTSGLDGNAIMLVQAGDSNTVRDNTVTTSFRGVRIGHPDYGPGVQTNLTLRNNKISNSADDGILIFASSMTGGTIRDNFITQSVAYDLEVQAGNTNSTIRNNHCSTSSPAGLCTQ